MGTVQSEAMSRELPRMNVPAGHGSQAPRPPRENVFPRQSVHEEAMKSAVNVPAGQLEHDVAPTPEMVPGPQGVQEVAPEAAAMLPATHVAHTVCPAVSAAVPGVQGEHATWPVRGCAEPGGQSAQMGGKLPEPAARADPRGQGAHPADTGGDAVRSSMRKN